MSSFWQPLDDHDDSDESIMTDPLEELQSPRKARDDFIKYMKNEVFRLNFYRAHMLYFIIVIFVSSLVVYGQGRADGPKELGSAHMTYTDALFLCCSAMTTTGKPCHQISCIHRLTAR